MSESSENQSSSFLVGFTWGLIAGAAGYFLFGTDQGRKVRHQIAQEWEEQVNQVTESSHPPEKVSLRKTIANFIQELTTEENAVASAKNPPKKNEAKPKTKSKKFKGV